MNKQLNIFKFRNITFSRLTLHILIHFFISLSSLLLFSSYSQHRSSGRGERRKERQKEREREKARKGRDVKGESGIV